MPARVRACAEQSDLNVSRFERDGYLVVDDVLTSGVVDTLRGHVLAVRNEGWWSMACRRSHGVTMPNFVARPQLASLRRLLEEPLVLSALTAVFRGQRFRFCGHSDVGIDRLVPWHKDKLNGAYTKHQTLPIWLGRQADATDLASPTGVGHKILKAAFYLQSHKSDDAGLTVVPGSHLAPQIATAGACQLHPRKGAMVLFDQRITHRGVTSQHTNATKGRVLVTLGFGRDNAHTREFERGTRERQQDQSRLIEQACGSCQGAQEKNCTLVAAPAATKKAWSPHKAGGAEAYVTMFYGPTDTIALSGLFVLLDSIRQHDPVRNVLVLRLHDDNRSAALEYACMRFAPCIVRRVPRLVLNPATHPMCARHLNGWANSSARSALALGAPTGVRHPIRTQNKWWAEHGAKTVPLALRSVFTVFTAWNLTEYKRIIWLESDQIVLRPLEPLWRTPLGNDTDAAAVPVGGLSCDERGRAAKYNTGVVLMQPSAATYARLVAVLAGTKRHVRGRKPIPCTDGSQTMWNRVLAPNVLCLPRTYNCLHTCAVQAVVLLHFAGATAKPWHVVLMKAGGAGARNPEVRAKLLKQHAYREWAVRAARLAGEYGRFVRGGVVVTTLRSASAVASAPHATAAYEEAAIAHRDSVDALDSGSATRLLDPPAQPAQRTRNASLTDFSCNFLEERNSLLLRVADDAPRCTPELLAKAAADFNGLNGGGLPYCLPDAERRRASLLAVLGGVKPRSLLALKSRTCAVVGSSGWLRGSRLGRSIDKHDVVIRLNGAPANGSRFTQDVGERTTIRMFDIGAYATQFDWTSKHVDELRAAEYVLVSTSHPSGYDRIAHNLLTMDKVPLDVVRPPAVQLQPALLPLVVGLPSRVALLSPSVAARAHTAVGWSGGRGHLARPTTGVMATLFALDFCASVDLYGFSWGSGDQRELAHYWRPTTNASKFRPCRGPTRICGGLSSKAHNLNGEFALFHALRASKLVGWHPDAPGMPKPTAWRGCSLPLPSLHRTKDQRRRRAHAEADVPAHQRQRGHCAAASDKGGYGDLYK